MPIYETNYSSRLSRLSNRAEGVSKLRIGAKIDARVFCIRRHNAAAAMSAATTMLLFEQSSFVWHPDSVAEGDAIALPSRKGSDGVIVVVRMGTGGIPTAHALTSCSRIIGTRQPGTSR